jgi:hypothetical protein
VRGSAKFVSFPQVFLYLDTYGNGSKQVVTTVQLKPALTAIIPKSSTKKRKGKEKETHVSRRFTFDPAHSRISFLSYDVENAVDDFLREWGRVERMCRIARDGVLASLMCRMLHVSLTTFTVAAMQKQKSWDGVRLLFFDFETVKIAYVQVRDSSIPSSTLLIRPFHD